jgi:hypothetical protein
VAEPYRGKREELVTVKEKYNWPGTKETGYGKKEYIASVGACTPTSINPHHAKRVRGIG